MVEYIKRMWLLKKARQQAKLRIMTTLNEDFRFLGQEALESYAKLLDAVNRS